MRNNIELNPDTLSHKDLIYLSEVIRTSEYRKMLKRNEMVGYLQEGLWNPDVRYSKLGHPKYGAWRYPLTWRLDLYGVNIEK